MTRPVPALALALTAVFSTTASADEISDTLQAAMDAYAAGDIAKTIEELSFAEGLLQRLRAASFADFLPPAPEGWTREVDTNIAAGLMMAGAGVGAEGTYSKNGESFSLIMLAGSPMAGMLGALLNNPMMAEASGAEVIRVGNMKVLQQDSELSAIIDSRILIQASGAAPEIMIPVLESIDIAALEGFKL